MSLAFTPVDLLATATTGSGTYDVNATARELKLFIVGTGTITAGTVTLEEAHDPTYTGAWSSFEAPIAVPSNAVVTRPYSGCFKAVRARVSDTIVGGTVTVKLFGNKEP